jgi:hypothetical protein
MCLLACLLMPVTPLSAQSTFGTLTPSSLNITSSSFARVTATQTVDQAGPRTIQFSLRVSF